jgi:hypothetical protein
MIRIEVSEKLAELIGDVARPILGFIELVFFFSRHPWLGRYGSPGEGNAMH